MEGKGIYLLGFQYTLPGAMLSEIIEKKNKKYQISLSNIINFQKWTQSQDVPESSQTIITIIPLP